MSFKSVCDHRSMLTLLFCTTSEIMKSQLHDTERIQGAADEDWFVLLHSKFMEKAIKNPIDQRELRGELLSAYIPLCEMFKTYGASSSAVGTAHELEYTEFRSMVYDLHVFPPHLHGTHNLQDTISKIFTRCHCPSSNVNTIGMTSHQLIKVQTWDKCCEGPFFHGRSRVAYSRRCRLRRLCRCAKLSPPPSPPHPSFSLRLSAHTRFRSTDAVTSMR